MAQLDGNIFKNPTTDNNKCDGNIAQIIIEIEVEPYTDDTNVIPVIKWQIHDFKVLRYKFGTITAEQLLCVFDGIDRRTFRTKKMIDSISNGYYNHDVTHSLRSLAYLEKLFDVLDPTLASTHAQKNIVRLGIFLKRVGRWDEKPTVPSGDQHKVRSATIFNEYAKMFADSTDPANAAVIKSVSEAITTETAPNCPVDKLTRLFNFIHNTEFIRITPTYWTDHFNNTVQWWTDHKMLKNGVAVKTVHDKLFEYANTLITATYAPKMKIGKDVYLKHDIYYFVKIIAGLTPQSADVAQIIPSATRHSAAVPNSRYDNISSTTSRTSLSSSRDDTTTRESSSNSTGNRSSTPSATDAHSSTHISVPGNANGRSAGNLDTNSHDNDNSVLIGSDSPSDHTIARVSPTYVDTEPEHAQESSTAAKLGLYKIWWSGYIDSNKAEVSESLNRIITKLWYKDNIQHYIHINESPLEIIGYLCRSIDTDKPPVLMYLILHIKDYQYPSVCYNGIVVPETTPTDTIYDYYAHYFDKSFGAIAANGKKWGRMPPRPRNRYDDNGNAIGHINW